MALTFTESKNYTYLLELDEKRNIIGGEWIGESKKKHMDFIWAPTRAPSDDVSLAGITFAQVKELLAESVNGSC